jgi:glyoxylase-like metal-dependent hydrolase (beta-lactamase superfamily II)/rhodanese-related sulfurtransferase
VLLRQFVDGDLGCASYLVGDEQAGAALVVDPAYAVEQYVEEAERRGVRIVRTLETHTHADHLSGHGRLAREHDIPVSVHPAAEAAYPFDPLDDGQVLEVGAVRVRVVHTPGHRPEHCSFVVDEQAALTGDSLFVGDAARPDLAVEARAGAESLFRSLRRLAELPAGVAVYPGHVAGSLCGRSMSTARSSTIGAELRSNAAFACEDLQDFVDSATGAATPRPPNLERIVELNRGPFVGAAPEVPRLDRPGGATVLDVRPAAVFAAGHVAGALNIPVTASSFATRAAFVLSPDERIVVHAGSEEERERAVRGLRAVGFLELAGYLEDPATPARLDPVRIDELAALLDAGAVELIDVRELAERDHGYIAGSRHVPYRLLRRCDAAEVANGKPVVTICETGARAAIAASVLAAAGVDTRPVLDGGVADWRGATVSFRRCGTA